MSTFSYIQPYEPYVPYVPWRCSVLEPLNFNLSCRDNVNTGHANSSNQAWAIQSPASFENVSLLLPPTMTTVYPGGKVPFQIESRDEYGKPAVSFIQVTQLRILHYVVAVKGMVDGCRLCMN